ncbi:MAG: family 20 glycosylhydrolase [Mangrovibacterium sp.]
MDEDIYVYFWRDWVNENPRIITGKGYPVVFMPWSHFYLSSEPGHQRLKELYEFDITADYPAMADSKVLGYQACVWTEEIPNEVQFEKHVFPALQAFSERVWSTERDWDDFERRVRAMGE